VASHQRDRLREARHRAGLSQRALAEQIGVAYPTVARIELEQHRPTLDVALAIARALGTSVESMFGDGDD
jgi:putative transcriptional regulator